MNNQDLRVVKTRANIKNTFYEMLKKEPVEKISVTELAKQAQINKSTFYLHYQDIYALYNEIRDDFLKEMVQSMDYCSLFLTDPEEFFNRFFNTLQENGSRISFLWPKHDMFLYQPNLSERTMVRIYEDCDIEKNARNDMALNIIVSSTFRISLTYMREEPGASMEILLSLVHAFFPVEEPAPSDSGS